MHKEKIEMKQEVKLGNIMVDCDDEIKLQKFYGKLLGWEQCTLFDRPAVRSSNEIVFLFMQEENYVRPIWPEKLGHQQKQMHFDFQVPDVLEAVKIAEKLGAVKTENQFGGDHFITMIDPAGHPFCLCKAD